MSKNTDHKRISYCEFLLYIQQLKTSLRTDDLDLVCRHNTSIYRFYFLRQGRKKKDLKKPTVAATTNKCIFLFKVGVLKGGKGRVIART